jgi:hypothetical protein
VQAQTLQQQLLLHSQVPQQHLNFVRQVQQ